MSSGETAFSGQEKVPYKAQMFESIVRQGGLMVTGSGLGVRDVLVKCIQMHCSPRGVVFVLRASSNAGEILSDLEDNGVPAMHLPRVLNSSTSTTAERERLYLEGGCFIITPRILVLDMLQKRVQLKSITGLIVNNAHGITAASTESFILRMYREGNSCNDAFVMAFTEEARATVGGYNKIGKLMETLSVNNLFLWPRFELSVKRDLGTRKPQVVQLAVDLTPAMLKIQSAIVEIMAACTDQLAKDSRVDLSDITKEINVLPNAEMRIRMKLRKVWNTMKASSRELVADLGSLRALLQSLITLDCVSFYATLDSVRRTASMTLGMGSRIYHKDPSPWLLLEAADVLFSTARDRVYKLRKVTTASGRIATVEGPSRNPEKVYSAGHVGEKRKRSTIRREMILEQNPKWLVLSHILKEVRSTKSGSETASYDIPSVAIFCRDERTVHQLNSVLNHGGLDFLRRRFDRFSAEMKRRTRDSSMVGSEPILNSNRARKSHNMTSSDTQDSKKKVTGHSSFRSFEHAMSSMGMTSTNEMLSNWWNLEVRKTRQLDGSKPVNSHSLVRAPKHGQENKIHFCIYDRRTSWKASAFLKIVKPEYIVMYDADPALTRELEVYAADQADLRVRVYFLVYDGSVEERYYLSEVEQERNAFRQLIQHKSHMARTHTSMKSSSLVSSSQFSKAKGRFTSKTSSRKGGGSVLAAAEAIENSCVVVDSREFRSALPLMLHQVGIEIIPMTLTVGDYILTPKRCVERKSIPDLFGSLRSGRLYKQAEQMCRHFEQPMLLIEFDDDRDFCLIDANSIPREISEYSIQSKLVLVILHFPALHFLWMSSPRQTASCFARLKVNEDEPEDHIAQIAGVNGESAGVAHAFDSTRDDASYVASQDALRRIPGVTASNWKSVSRSVPNLAALASMSLEELRKILGGKGLARKAWNFFHKEPTSADL